MKKGLLFFISAIILFFSMISLAISPSNSVENKTPSIKDIYPQDSQSKPESLNKPSEKKFTEMSDEKITPAPLSKPSENPSQIMTSLLNPGRLLFIFSILMFFIFLVAYPRIVHLIRFSNNQSDNETLKERKDNLKGQMEFIRLACSIALSFIVVLTALYIIIGHNDPESDSQKWAFGAVGTIIGYWFKT